MQNFTLDWENAKLYFGLLSIKPLVYCLPYVIVSFHSYKFVLDDFLQVIVILCFRVNLINLIKQQFIIKA